MLYILQGRYHNISIQCQLKLFDSMVLSVLLYGSRIWGFENLSLKGKLCNRFFNILLPITSAKSYTMIFIICRTWTFSGTHFCKIKNDCLLV